MPYRNLVVEARCRELLLRNRQLQQRLKDKAEEDRLWVRSMVKELRYLESEIYGRFPSLKPVSNHRRASATPISSSDLESVMVCTDRKKRSKTVIQVAAKYGVSKSTVYSQIKRKLKSDSEERELIQAFGPSAGLASSLGTV
jgi:pantothenate kinase